jgi:hypothetical protein
MKIGFGISLINNIRALYKLILKYWVTDSGDNIVDNSGNKIVFRDKE